MNWLLGTTPETKKQKVRLGEHVSSAFPEDVRWWWAQQRQEQRSLARIAMVKKNLGVVKKTMEKNVDIIKDSVRADMIEERVQHVQQQTKQLFKIRRPWYYQLLCGCV